MAGEVQFVPATTGSEQYRRESVCESRSWSHLFKLFFNFPEAWPSSTRLCRHGSKWDNNQSFCSRSPGGSWTSNAEHVFCFQKVNDVSKWKTGLSMTFPMCHFVIGSSWLHFPRSSNPFGSWDSDSTRNGSEFSSPEPPMARTHRPCWSMQRAPGGIVVAGCSTPWDHHDWAPNEIQYQTLLKHGF